MATRLQFQNGSTLLGYAQRPTPDAGWTLTTRTQYTLRENPGSGGVVYASITDFGTGMSKSVATNPSNILAMQAILPNLRAQTITGNVKGQAKFDESAAALDASVQTCIRVLSRDGTTVRGTLLSLDTTGAISGTAGTAGYEISTSTTNRKVPTGWSGSGAALTSVTSQNGDMLVVEIGIRAFTAATGGTATFTTNFGQTTDLAEDETSTNTNNSWIEFSNNISYGVANTRLGGVLANGQRVTTVSKIQATDVQRMRPRRGQLWPRGGRPT